MPELTHASRQVQVTRNYNLFCVIVGQTAKARKGTSLGQVQRVMSAVDAAWNEARVMSGLSSGEGLIWAERDEIRQRIPVRERGRTAGYEDVVSDNGELDKRLLVVEPEFARVLQVTEREANTLSAILGQAWDTGELQVLTRKQAARASGAHISLIGHITKDELRRLLTDTAAGNGFANRSLWICARRSKLLPEGGAWHLAGAGPLICRLRAAAEFSRAAETMSRDDEAQAMMHHFADPSLLSEVASVLLDCGLRPEECSRLRHKHVRDGKIEIPYGKTDNARRRIPITARVQAILDLRRSKAGSCEWIFPAPTKSGHIEPSSLKKRHALAIREATAPLRQQTSRKTAEFQAFELYTLRHTCLTRWAPLLEF